MKLFSKNMNGVEKRVRDGIVGEIVVALVGAFMLLMPELALTVLIYIIASALCVIGILRIIGYVRVDVKGGIMGMGLGTGLALLTGGIVLFVFPMIPTYALFVILAGLLIAGGFAKIQMAIDVKRVGDASWWILLLLASASIIMGVIALFNPFGLAATLVSLIGAFMVVESVIDIYSIVAFKKKVDNLFIDQK